MILSILYLQRGILQKYENTPLDECSQTVLADSFETSVQLIIQEAEKCTAIINPGGCLPIRLTNNCSLTRSSNRLKDAIGESLYEEKISSLLIAVYFSGRQLV
jgi:hypothetical protein